MALCQAGHEAQAVRDLGLRDAVDNSIWNYALAAQAVIVTKDQDFAERSFAGKTAPAIVWIRTGNSSNRALLDWLLPLWPEVVRHLEAGDGLVEVRAKFSH